MMCTCCGRVVCRVQRCSFINWSLLWGLSVRHVPLLPAWLLSALRVAAAVSAAAQQALQQKVQCQGQALRQPQQQQQVQGHAQAVSAGLSEKAAAENVGTKRKPPLEQVQVLAFGAEGQVGQAGLQAVEPMMQEAGQENVHMHVAGAAATAGVGAGKLAAGKHATAGACIDEDKLPLMKRSRVSLQLCVTDPQVANSMITPNPDVKAGDGVPNTSSTGTDPIPVSLRRAFSSGKVLWCLPRLTAGEYHRFLVATVHVGRMQQVSVAYLSSVVAPICSICRHLELRCWCSTP